MPGDCHYLVGNLNAERRVKQLQGLLAEIGMEPQRVKMFNLSSAMASEFVRIAEEMTVQIENLGKNPLKKTQR